MDRQWLAEATALSTVGGPDGSGTRAFASAGLGHALLRIEPQDIAGPVTLDGRTWLTADVRLDGRDDLRRQLAGRGEGCRPGATDAELILHAHRAWGGACVEHLLGDFAFALWDERRGELLCARDQLGVAPLHVAQAGPCLVVASLLDAILLHPDVDDELDDEAIATFLVDGVPSDHIQTAYARVRRLAPAHTLEWTLHATTRRRYWRLDPHPPLLVLPRAEDYVALFSDVLDTAVADRIGTGPVSAHLSGGLDSGAIVASAAALLRARGADRGALRTVTAVLGGDSGDEEGDYAAEVRDALGVDGTVIDATDAQPTDPFAPPDFRLPEPAPYQRNDLQLRIARASIPGDRRSFGPRRRRAARLRAAMVDRCRAERSPALGRTRATRAHAAVSRASAPRRARDPVAAEIASRAHSGGWLGRAQGRASSRPAAEGADPAATAAVRPARLRHRSDVADHRHARPSDDDEPAASLRPSVL